MPVTTFRTSVLCAVVRAFEESAALMSFKVVCWLESALGDEATAAHNRSSYRTSTMRDESRVAGVALEDYQLSIRGCYRYRRASIHLHVLRLQKAHELDDIGSHPIQRGR
jgi:hypothetical protein